MGYTATDCKPDWQELCRGRNLGTNTSSRRQEEKFSKSHRMVHTNILNGHLQSYLPVFITHWPKKLFLPVEKIRKVLTVLLLTGENYLSTRKCSPGGIEKIPQNWMQARNLLQLLTVAQLEEVTVPQRQVPALTKDWFSSKPLAQQLMQDAEWGVSPELGEISRLQSYSGYRQQFVSTSSAAGALGSRERTFR